MTPMALRMLLPTVVAFVIICSCGDGLSLDHKPASSSASAFVILSALPTQIANRVSAPNSLPLPFTSFTVYRVGDLLFPEESQLQAWAAQNPDVRKYLDIPREARSQDLYFKAPEDLYWASEYFSKGTAVHFRCNFLIHFDQRSNKTMVSAYEFLPMVRLGQRLGITEHGPGFYYNDKWVSPTNKDKTELIKAVGALFKGRLDGK